MEQDRPKQNRLNIPSLAKGLQRFFGGDVGRATDAILAYLEGNPLASKGEIFAALSGGKGKKKPHASVKGDTGGKIDVGHGSKYRSLSRRRK
jgi:hypothetical protein